MKTRRRRLRQSLLGAASLLVTPTLLFISTTIPIYIRNQDDLNNQIDVLLPFVFLFFATLLVGLILWWASGTRLGRVLLWAYYLGGPIFLFFNVIGSNAQEPTTQLLVLGAFVVGTALLSVVAARYVEPGRVTPLFATIGCLLLLYETFQFIGGVNWAREEPGSVNQRAMSAEKTQEELPNVYHFVLDAFQSDVFSRLITDKLAKELSGFTFFSEATALYSHTTWAVPSVFLGATYDFTVQQAEYLDRAFNSEDSVLFALKTAGYSTAAYTKKLYPIELKLFDNVQQPTDAAVPSYGNIAAFGSAWIYRYVPVPIRDFMAERDILIDKQGVSEFETGMFLPDSAPQESMSSFQRFLDAEKNRPGSDQYTFVHLMLPHSPYIYGSDCVLDKAATVISQSQCTTQLMVRFVQELKQLGRFEKSFIVVHGDHGDKFRIQDGELFPQRRRSHRALLLIKPVGIGDDSALATNSKPVTLLDVTATLRELGQPSRIASDEGSSLLGGEISGSARKPVYQLVGNDKMREHAINGLDLVFISERPIPQPDEAAITSNIGSVPVLTVNDVIEAEVGAASGAVDKGATLPGTSGQHISNGLVSYRFTVPEAGRYRLRARLITPSGNNNSAFVRLDSKKPRVWAMSKSRTWQWQDAPFEWTLDKGTHMLTLENREQIWIDKLELSEVKK